MRIDRVNMGVELGEDGKVRTASVYFENSNERGERISGNFAITVDQYAAIQDGSIKLKEIAEKRIAELFEIKADEDSSVALAELKESSKAKDKELKELKAMIAELTIMVSNLGVGESETVPDTDSNPSNTEVTGGRG